MKTEIILSFWKLMERFMGYNLEMNLLKKDLYTILTWCFVSYGVIFTSLNKLKSSTQTAVT
ncbi:hypothetical protein NIES19_25160 [Anabaena cylindrica PCC 7122]|nr:hypothetical protein NIES19_25160 [Anabaena cylindrica PCC 7122]